MSKRLSLEPNQEIVIRKGDVEPIKIRKSSDGKYQMWSFLSIGKGWVDLPQSVESIEHQLWKYTQNDL